MKTIAIECCTADVIAVTVYVVSDSDQQVDDLSGRSQGDVKLSEYVRGKMQRMRACQLMQPNRRMVLQMNRYGGDSDWSSPIKDFKVCLMPSSSIT